ncbi:type II toxin-antitoxin system VapC family toxin [Fodinibius halophilus]|uniref:Type II toxin-antitoxin system VapC family toxin n=1 Tax=Fodinibius halophilus TaxID=1736908 RepID=A0A6M1T6S0_9BACT|nr:PIN domain-containing protein [Fodinibius halophilus]NGP88333.1 type II toxin-antitoxin system VapC family toxin [Fodinibius halophilus]
MGFKVYLDNCCFNRPFDDQSQIRIHIETEAKLYIQREIVKGNLHLGWSYILDYENSANPFEFRKTSIIEWKKKAYTFVEESDRVLKQAKAIRKGHGLKTKDALHIACAIVAECTYFITTDDEIINKGSLVTPIETVSPVDMITIMEEQL